jgi:putative ubiquitin-RnfH superfamily antitoxin RatB of RatAB toxin-antitoxin module
MSDGTAQTDLLDIEVVYALPEEQTVISVSLPAGSTVRDAVAQSGLLDKQWPNENLKIIPGETPVGIFGERVSYDEPLDDGDRVEIYRPLVLDPMEARRARARSQKQQTTGRS